MKPKISSLIDSQTIKKSISKQLFNLTIIFASTIYSVFTWWPTRYYPNLLDAYTLELSSHINYISQYGYFNFIQFSNFFTTTPLFVYLLTFIPGWNSSLHIHLISLLSLITFILSTYFLATKINGKIIGIISLFLISLSPLLISEIAHTSPLLPAAALSTLSLSLLVYHYTAKSLLVFILSLLFHPIVLIILPIYWYYWLKISHNKSSTKLLPLLPIILWLFWGLMTQPSVGWLLINPAYLNPNQFSISALNNTLKALFLDQGRWLLTLPVIITILLSKYERTKYKINQPIITIFMSVFLTSIVIVLLPHLSLRPLIVILPIFIIISLSLIFSSLQSLVNPKTAVNLLLILSLMVMLGWSSRWYPDFSYTTQYTPVLPVDLSIRDYITVFRQSAIQSQYVFMNKNIYGAMPEVNAFTYPQLGFVTMPVNIKPCSEYSSSNSDNSILILHPYSFEQQSCLEIFQSSQTAPLHRFESGNIWVEFYSITNATDSSRPNQVD